MDSCHSHLGICLTIGALMKPYKVRSSVPYLPGYSNAKYFFITDVDNDGMSMEVNKLNHIRNFCSLLNGNQQELNSGYVWLNNRI